MDVKQPLGTYSSGYFKSGYNKFPVDIYNPSLVCEDAFVVVFLDKYVCVSLVWYIVRDKMYKIK